MFDARLIAGSGGLFDECGRLIQFVPKGQHDKAYNAPAKRAVAKRMPQIAQR